MATTTSTLNVYARSPSKQPLLTLMRFTFGRVFTLSAVLLASTLRSRSVSTRVLRCTGPLDADCRNAVPRFSTTQRCEVKTKSREPRAYAVSRQEQNRFDRFKAVTLGPKNV